MVRAKLVPMSCNPWHGIARTTAGGQEEQGDKPGQEAVVQCMRDHTNSSEGSQKPIFKPRPAWNAHQEDWCTTGFAPLCYR